MSSEFYISIIEEEKSTFNIKDDTLKQAAKDVGRSYKEKALQKGSTFLDYNNASNRCAYLYKFATVHTGLSEKYFQQLLKKKEVLNILESKQQIRICGLGGGPGTDAIGICKAMANIPSLHKKVVQVTVLDICGGWRNSFKHVMSGLKHGKVEGVPASFVNGNDFKANLIGFDLLKRFPENIKKIISSADVISMVKFVSAVMGIPRSIEALKAIASLTKPGATVFFVDNFQGKVFEPLDNIAEDCGLTTAIGPLHELYESHITSIEKSLKPKIDAYGCLPVDCTRISMIGWIKTSKATLNLNHTSNPCQTANNLEEDGWDTDSDSEDSYAQLQTKTVVNAFHNSKQINVIPANASTDKFTQINIPDSSFYDTELAKMTELINCISELLEVIKRLTQWYETNKPQNNKHC